MKKYDFTLTVTVEKDFIGFEAENWDDAEAMAFVQFKEKYPNLRITDDYGKNFREHKN